jgi:aminoglycoside phosphotransferase
MTHLDQKTTDIAVKKLGINSPFLIGKGGERFIYDYGDKVIAMYHGDVNLDYLENIQKFLNSLSKSTFSFQTPEIIDCGEVDGICYSIEPKLSGIQMDKKIVTLNTIQRQKLYMSYYQAIRQLHQIQFPDLPYGNIINTPESDTAESWEDFIHMKLDRKVTKTRKSMITQVRNFDHKVALFKKLISKHLTNTQKNLIHSDYYLNNVLVDENLKISAILDLSVHAAVGDPRLDITSVLRWNEIDPHVKVEDYRFLNAQAVTDYGEEINKYADLYLLYSGFYFADMKDPLFSIKTLNDEALWEKYN